MASLRILRPMSLLGRLTGRTRPWRLLKALIGEAHGIRLALERHNQLFEAQFPDAALKVNPAGPAAKDPDPSITYVTDREILAAEYVRDQLHQATGRWPAEEEVAEALMGRYRDWLESFPGETGR